MESTTIASQRSVRPRSYRRQLARLIEITFSRLSALTVQAQRLHERVAHSAGYTSLRQCVDALLHELQQAARVFTRRASALGAHLPPTAAATKADAAARKSATDELLRLPADLAARLIEDCQACGKNLCELLRTAHAAHDATSEQVAYSLLRTLEKQLWLLRPHSETAHPFLIGARTA